MNEEQKNINFLLQKHSRVAGVLESLNPDPRVLVSDEGFIEKFSRLEKLLTELFAIEEEYLRQAGVSDSEMKKHIEEHDRLLLNVVGVYETAMAHQKVSAADVYKSLRTEMAEHMRQFDARVFPV